MIKALSMEPTAMLLNLTGPLHQPVHTGDYSGGDGGLESMARNDTKPLVLDGTASPVSAGEAVVFAAFTSACICATIIGNILVILSVFTYRPLRNVANFFIVSLAVADLAVAILVMPFNVANFIIGHWVFGEVFCNMWLTFDVLTCTASILNLCAVAVDRYYAIHDPINYAQKRTMVRVLISIAIVWLASAVISVPPLFGWNNRANSIGLYDKWTSMCQLTDERSYVIYSASGSFFIPLFIMTFVYVNVFRAVRRRLRERADAATAAKLAAAVGKGSQKGTSARSGGSMMHKSNDSATLEQSSGEAGDMPPPDTDNGAVLPLDQQASVDFSSSKSMRKLMEDTDGVNNSEHTSGHDKRGDGGGGGGGRGGGRRRGSSGGERGGGGRGQVQQFLEEKARISLSKERRAARTMAIIMGVFVLCWLPFFLMYVIFPFCPSCADTDPRLINFIVWLGYINSSLNPVIYTIFNIDFRRAFKKLLQGNWRGH